MLDGREDYQRYLGVRLPFFFISNASNNLRFLTPLESQQLRQVESASMPARPKLGGPLPTMVQWTVSGRPRAPDMLVLEEYRKNGTFLTLQQGCGRGGVNSMQWFSALLPACTEVARGCENIGYDPAPADGGGIPSSPSHQSQLPPDRFGGFSPPRLPAATRIGGAFGAPPSPIAGGIYGVGSRVAGVGSMNGPVEEKAREFEGATPFSSVHHLNGIHTPGVTPFSGISPLPGGSPWDAPASSPALPTCQPCWDAL
mmetsp:Transcript_153692/g.491478  ORF Transcript_153692/g.491478 Transcript_153692/m.491478 type:complete len:256 (-) Transcript_153692:53-820(-)